MNAAASPAFLPFRVGLIGPRGLGYGLAAGR